MVDVTEIFIHWYAGRSLSEVSVSLGVDRKTIRKYLAPAVAAGLVPGGPVMSGQDWTALVTAWFPHLADTRLRQTTWRAPGTTGRRVPATPTRRTAPAAYRACAD